MIIYSKEDFIAVLKRTLSGAVITDDWEDLMMATVRGDTFTMHWANKIAAVEALYPPTRSSELFSRDGCEYLEKILTEIISLDTE